MKHYIIFTTIFSLSCAMTHAMDNIQEHEKRSLRDELLCMQAIKQQVQIPKKITLSILYKAYLLRDINTLTFRYDEFKTRLPKEKLCFELLDKRAVIDFLYLTNKQETTFLKLEPSIIDRAAEIAYTSKKTYTKNEKAIWCINIIKTEANYNNYLNLPQKIKDYSWWFVTEYEG
jgi:hypothetical protein